MIYKELYREKHIRQDGWLSELASVNYRDKPFDCLHSYLVCINPQRTRAEHYHKKKGEWLGITSGKIMLFLEDTQSKEKDNIILDMDAKGYKLIYIPPLTAHLMENIGDKEASVVIFSKTPEDLDDTIPYKIEMN